MSIKSAGRSRSSQQWCFVRKGILRNFTKFTGKHLCQGLFFNIVVGPRPATLLKKRLWHKCFPVDFVKFPRTSFLQNTSGDCFCRSLRYEIILKFDHCAHLSQFSFIRNNKNASRLLIS